MGDPSAKPQKSRLPQIRTLLAFLILLTSPCALCGLLSLLDSLPPSTLPGAMDFSLNLFESEVRIENRSGETLYLTPITTTFGRPMVIRQSSLRQRDIPVEPGGSAVLTYDAADSPLAGVVVCRSGGECRLLETTYAQVQVLDSFEALPDAEADWLAAIRSEPPINMSVVILPLFGLIPILLFAIWLYLGRLQKQRNRQEVQQALDALDPG